MKYADLLIVITLSNVILCINYFRKKTTPENSKDSFFDDQPIEGKIEEDKLKYNDYARTIAEKILKSNFKKSFAIGVNAKWGLGKTSFINLIKQNLNKIKPDSEANNFIEIDFNPWNSQNPENIIQDFFATLQKEIQPYHSSLARLFIQYSNKLLNFKSNFLTQTFHAIVSLFTGIESTDSLHKKLNEALGKINRKLIIYIDDLDRLDSKEVLEVIRLIRNTANFGNTFFVVAYDRNYVINALEQQNSHKPEEFLEKIFQLEITLPYFDKGVLIKELVEKLGENFLEYKKELADFESMTSIKHPELSINWFENMRDVIRFVNTFILNFQELKGEVVFKDFFRLEMLRVKYPSVVHLISRKNSDFLEIQQGIKSFYGLKKIDEHQTKFYLEEYLNKTAKELSIPQDEIKKIIVFIKNIFSFQQSETNFLSVIYPSKFGRYFKYSLMDDDLSEIEFSKARASKQEEFNSKIENWLESGLDIKLYFRFKEINAFDDKEDFEKVIKAIFHFSIYKPKSNTYVGAYDAIDLANKIMLPQNLNFYPKDGKSGLKSFILNLLQNAKNPYYFEAGFLHRLNEKNYSNFILNEEERIKLNISFLTKYLSETVELNHNVWKLFHCTKKINWIKQEDGTSLRNETLSEEVKEMMKKFLLEKDFNQFLYDVIGVAPSSKYTYYINSLVKQIFDSEEKFEKILNEKNQADYEYLKEFKAFFAKCKEKGFANTIDFDFKIMPVDSKITRY